MINHRTATVTALAAAAPGAPLAVVAPAFAGGIGDVLAPAFATSCANQHTGAYATGNTTHGTGTAAGNLAGLPLGSPLNQCGGADLNLKNLECVSVQDINVIQIVDVEIPLTKTRRCDSRLAG
ncbi:chaplin family protein [Streptomyces sp. NPDC126503]|uniref:chaplin family protein n=1 Tax=Streptomyces sp. NPDC126503 TaxID=3155315 RepID=UPI00331EB063